MTKTEWWLVVGLAELLGFGMAFQDWRSHRDTGSKPSTVLHAQANPGMPLVKPPRGYALVKCIFHERDGSTQDAFIAEQMLEDGLRIDYLLPGESALLQLSPQVPGAPGVEGGKP